ncbi:hypothetical protein [Burkholderia vietnamiensis]|uniref:hypothetical protein n=1 Tax=Burkholderia vietnamiensis TaxID=60552 RepID=UPI0012DAE8DA|nr:hypothetical protein [Burkholderia vietnamiensis]
MDNLWSTWEVHCWAAGFAYIQYERDHPGPNKPLSCSAWLALCNALNIQLDNDIGGQS